MKKKLTRKAIRVVPVDHATAHHKQQLAVNSWGEDRKREIVDILAQALIQFTRNRPLRKG